MKALLRESRCSRKVYGTHEVDARILAEERCRLVKLAFAS